MRCPQFLIYLAPVAGLLVASRVQEEAGRLHRVAVRDRVRELAAEELALGLHVEGLRHPQGVDRLTRPEGAVDDVVLHGRHHRRKLAARRTLASAKSATQT